MLTNAYKLGDEGICCLCGSAVRYIGKYWMHTTSSPMHPAKPANGKIIFRVPTKIVDDILEVIEPMNTEVRFSD